MHVMSVTPEPEDNIVELPRKVRIRRRRDSNPWLVPLVLVAMSLAYMVGHLSH
jgi:hypothetical protein